MSYSVLLRKCRTAARVLRTSGARAALHLALMEAANRVAPRLGHSPAIPLTVEAIEHHNRTTLTQLRATLGPIRRSPTLSIVVPIYKTKFEWAATLIDSLNGQTDQNFEVLLVYDGPQENLQRFIDAQVAGNYQCRSVALPANIGVAAATNAGILAATGDFIVVVDHDDALSPLFVAAFRFSATATESDIFYSDEALMDADGAIFSLSTRGVFDLRYYLSHPYVVHPIFINREVALSAGLLREDMSVSHDVDFFLRCLSRSKSVTSIPLVTYYWRINVGSLGHTKQCEVMAATKGAITRFIQANYNWKEFSVDDGPHFNTFAVRPPVAKDAKAAVIIPTKNKTDLVRACLDSLLARTEHNDVPADIFVVDHASTEAELAHLLQKLESARKIRVIRYAGPWNFSAINNFACDQIAQRGNYTHFVFANNDIEMVTDDWLDAMISKFSYGDVGTVGCCLIYSNGTVQHGGVVVGLCGLAEHSHKFFPFYRNKQKERHIGYLGSLTATRDYAAVTAALMVVPADLFFEVGGFDEALAVGYGDTDLCLRIGELGLKSCYSGDVVAVHHESLSRGKGGHGDPHPWDSQLFCARHQHLIAAGDPHYGAFMRWDTPSIGFGSPMQKRVMLRVASVPRLRALGGGFAAAKLQAPAPSVQGSRLRQTSLDVSTAQT